MSYKDTDSPLELKCLNSTLIMVGYIPHYKSELKLTPYVMYVCVMSLLLIGAANLDGYTVATKLSEQSTKIIIS